MTAIDRSSDSVTFGATQARIRDGSLAALSAVQQATSGVGPALKVTSDNADTAAVKVRGAGDLLDLQDSSGVSQFSVSQAGAVTASGDQSVTGDLAVTGNVTVTSGDVSVATAGNGLAIATGANARMGSATLVGGTVTVANTSVTASTLVFVSRSTTGGTEGHLSTTQIASTSFTVNSSSGTDTSTVNWLLIEPA